MSRYKVIESRRWYNLQTGAYASIYGATPWTNESKRHEWQMITVGYTVMDLVSNVVGMGRKPFTTSEEARQFANRLEGGPA